MNKCDICGEEKTNKHHYYLDSWIESVCENQDVDWHRQATRLTHEMSRTSSNFLTVLLESELKEILATKVCTKKY